MFYDYNMPVEWHQNSRMNVFDKKYWEILPEEGVQLHRMPVTADVEYLVVEGVYYVWQSTGDTTFVKKWLPALEKGLMYSMTDPVRWSKKYQLIKRAYTLDTWDFQQIPVPKDELAQKGYDLQDVLFNVNEDTPKGIMHGDNSGLYAACRQLALLHTALGNETDSKVWNHYAEIIRLRTNEVCWNGKFYKHFAIEDEPPAYNTMDQENTLGLSNTYDINRGLPTEEMAESIIQTYYNLIEETRGESFAEWFGVYPPAEPYFGTHIAGDYMNGGVITVVAGELAKAALQHGFEDYGIDIINRLIEITENNNGDLPCVFLPDGTKGRGVPDIWGQAAVASALIEGLAGVVDDGTGFDHVTLSPRWSYTDRRNLKVNVVYGPSGKSISYDYIKKDNEIIVDIHSKSSIVDCHILLPKGIDSASATSNGKSVSSNIEKIRESYYIVIEGMEGGNHQVKVNWKQ